MGNEDSFVLESLRPVGRFGRFGFATTLTFDPNAATAGFLFHLPFFPASPSPPRHDVWLPTLRRGSPPSNASASASPERRRAHFHTNKILCTTRIESVRTKGPEASKQTERCMNMSSGIMRIRRADVVGYRWKCNLSFFFFFSQSTLVCRTGGSEPRKTRWRRRNVSVLFEEAPSRPRLW